MTFQISISTDVAEFIWRNRALGCYRQVQGRYLSDEQYMQHSDYLIQRGIPVDLDLNSRFYQIERVENDMFSPMWRIRSKDLLRNYRPIGVEDHVVGLISGNMQGALSGDIVDQITIRPGTVVSKWILDEEFDGTPVHFLTFEFERPVHMEHGDENSEIVRDDDSETGKHRKMDDGDSPMVINGKAGTP
ncbi:hypothetical protein PLICRDRAFT_699584 [Plicaturopsis crispa FD-325 SS-3]|nr:hypothetical protein PLICRDRAFT_699584 [Plicaturopsis crispa FD-325 SS-3]